mgnify:CR=1 FL=1
MEIRTATIADLAQIAAVEAECFPAAEAATKEEFELSIMEIISGSCLKAKS